MTVRVRVLIAEVDEMDSYDDTELALMKFGVGQPVPRMEDPTLLRGQGRYTDDINLPGQAYAVMVRSRIAHGILKGIDTAAARAMPGVLAVLDHRGELQRLRNHDRLDPEPAQLRAAALELRDQPLEVRDHPVAQLPGRVEVRHRDRREPDELRRIERHQPVVSRGRGRARRPGR